MKILSLDLGLTSGYAVFDTDYLVDVSGDFCLEYGEILEKEHANRIPHLKQKWTPELVVIEEPLIERGELGNALKVICTICDHAFPTAEKITPSQWKPTPWGNSPTPRGASTHERDAIRLGVWFANSRCR